MATITASCGHAISWARYDSGKGEICVKDYARDGERCACYMVACPKCVRWYKKAKMILRTRGAIDRWIGGNNKHG